MQKVRNANKNMKKENKGITLIALVITIIVLLILAGVSIATLTGENGLLTRAGEAKTETKKAGAQEKVQMEVAGSFDNNGKFNIDNLKDNLQNNLGVTATDDADGGITVIVDGETIKVDKNGNVTIEGEGSGGSGPVEDTSGANIPVIEDGMVGITYDENGNPQEVADATKKDWYSYEETTDEDMTDGGTTDGGNSRWANARLNGDYYVWIPRYAYKIDNTVTYTSQKGTSNKIDVKFIGTDVTSSNVATKVGEGYIVHPAFTFGTDELTGLWVGKYETTGTASAPTILPGEISLRDINVSTMFSTAQSLSTASYDAHMMKNTEWGAVAYLAQSKYGRNGTEISDNQCSDCYTGVGRGTGDNKIYNSEYSWGTITADQRYNGTIGQLSSTTGNTYGIYDMSGGAIEYVMGVYGTAGNPTVGYSGFTTFPEAKYYDLYTNTSVDSSNIGDALYETKGWNLDEAIFVSSTYPFFLRGGFYIDAYDGGLFGFAGGSGSSNGYNGFRVCLAV